MIRAGHLIIILAFLPAAVTVTAAAERFPPPEFETGYELPPVENIRQAVPRGDIYEYLDVVVLVAALGLASYLILKKRSRRWIYTLMIFSLLYFGFWREGCVCPIGAVQNVALSIFDPTYAMPLTVTLFFVLPLLFTLFFGRTFCAAVCPLGAMQDVVAFRPIAIPGWLESGLRLFAYVYLGAAVLFAATGSSFIICRYDPFVSFFRMTGWMNILILGVCILVIGIFVGRPYCRFLCPYGVILRHVSRVSRKRVTITPDECIKCGLCVDSCPFGAIREPTADWPAGYYVKSKRRLGLLILLLPVLILLFGLLGSQLKGIASRAHSTVRLADRVHLEDAGKVEGTTDASDAFRATGRDVEDLNAEAAGIISQFGTGGWFFGGFVGLVTGLTLISLTVQRKRTDYEADRGSCLACGRCFEYCPREHQRHKQITETIGGN